MNRNIKFSSLLTLLLLGLSTILTGQEETNIPTQVLHHNSDISPDYIQRFKSYFSQTENENIDALHYDLSLDLTAAAQTETVSGCMILTGLVTGDLPVLHLDLINQLTVDSIKVDRQMSSSWTHDNNQIAVPLPDPAPDDTIEITVYYHGHPAGDYGEGMDFDTHNGTPVVYSLSEPDFARWWWPSIDIPSDKATFTGHFRVPAEWVAASNGVLDTVITDTSNAKTYVWDEFYPISTYLVSITATNFVHFSDLYESNLSSDSMPVDFYVYPEDSLEATIDFDVTVPMIQTFASLFGEYPFLDEKYGLVEFPWAGGMEHQTLTSYGAALIRGNHAYDRINAHELAHQWWGDMITLGDWKDIWLNEGFASYGDALWFEHIGGLSQLNTRMSQFRTTYFNEDSRHRYPIYDPPDDYLFGSAEYEKAAWVLHMLRGIVGDTTFFDILHTYRSNFEYSTAVTSDFQNVVNSVTDTTFDWFFNEWIYDQGYPKYEYSFESAIDSTGGTYLSRLVVKQNQSNAPVFTMPVEIMLSDQQDTVYRKIWTESAQDTFELRSDFRPERLTFDPQQIILKTVSRNDQFVLQGHILALDGSPLSNANVAVLGPYTNGSPTSAVVDTTSDTGAFSNTLRSGVYVIQASKEGYQPSQEQVLSLDHSLTGLEFRLAQPEMTLTSADTLNFVTVDDSISQDSLSVTNSGSGHLSLSLAPAQQNPYPSERSLSAFGQSIPLQIQQHIAASVENITLPDRKHPDDTIAPVDSLWTLLWEEPTPDSGRAVDLNQLFLQNNHNMLFVKVTAHNHWSSTSDFEWDMAIDSDIDNSTGLAGASIGIDYIIAVGNFSGYHGLLLKIIGGNQLTLAAVADYEDIEEQGDHFVMGFDLSGLGNPNSLLFVTWVNGLNSMPFGVDYEPNSNLQGLFYDLQFSDWFHVSPAFAYLAAGETTTFHFSIDQTRIPDAIRSGHLLLSSGSVGGWFHSIPFSLNIPTGVVRDDSKLPTKFSLSQNYPNPFNPSTNLDYSVPSAGKLTFRIFNLRGQSVFNKTVTREPGFYTFHWDGKFSSNVIAPSGMYLVSMSYTGLDGRRHNQYEKILLIR